MTCLLDVNVLVALFDPTHVHHEIAHRWFGQQKPRGWATCPITENGLVRVLTNPSYPMKGFLADALLVRLRDFCASGGHAFLAADVSLTDAKRFDLAVVRGHKQLTDIYLLGLAEAHRARLATFDGSISAAALASKNQRVLLRLS